MLPLFVLQNNHGAYSDAHEMTIDSGHRFIYLSPFQWRVTTRNMWRTYWIHDDERESFVQITYILNITVSTTQKARNLCVQNGCLQTAATTNRLYGSHNSPADGTGA